jgi:predicted aspartyl protease
LVYVGNTKTNALVDTGADFSVMSKQFLDKTGFTRGQLKPASCKTTIAANGQHARILGKIQLSISIQNKHFNHLMHVLNNLHHSRMLGRDFCERNETKLDFSTDTFELDDNPKINYVTHVQLQKHKPGLARTKSVNTIP